MTRDEISDLITAESGLSKKDSLYEVGRAFDVFSLTGQLCILDDGQIFSCDITPHGQKRKIFTQREPLQGVISAITPFNHPHTVSFRCCQFSPGGSKIEKAIVKIGTLSIKAIPMILGSHKRLVIFFIVRKCSLENPARSCL